MSLHKGLLYSKLLVESVRSKSTREFHYVYVATSKDKPNYFYFGKHSTECSGVREVLVSGLKLGDTCCRKSSKLGDKNPMKGKVPHNKGKRKCSQSS